MILFFVQSAIFIKVLLILSLDLRSGECHLVRSISCQRSVLKGHNTPGSHIEKRLLNQLGIQTSGEGVDICGSYRGNLPLTDRYQLCKAPLHSRRSSVCSSVVRGQSLCLTQSRTPAGFNGLVHVNVRGSLLGYEKGCQESPLNTLISHLQSCTTDLGQEFRGGLFSMQKEFFEILDTT